MGKSAKLHKRVPKKLKSTGGAPASASSTSNDHNLRLQNAKKKQDAKNISKAKSKPTSTSKSASAIDRHVLGGADYVSLMMGGRRKAKEESMKLPPSEDP